MQMILELIGRPTEEELEVFAEIKDKDILKKVPLGTSAN